MPGPGQWWQGWPGGPWPLRQWQPFSEAIPEICPPVPTTVYAVEFIQARPYTYIGWTFPTESAAAPDTPLQPTIVRATELPQQRPYVYVDQPIIEAAVPPKPYVVKAVEPPIERPYGFVERPYDTPVVASADTPQRPLVVGGIQPPIERPFKFLEFQATDPRADPVGKPVVVRCQELPIWRTTVLVNWTAVQADTPISATVVRGAEPPQPLPYSFVERTVADPPAAAPQVPLAPIAVRAQQPPLPQPFTYIGRPPTEPPAAAPQLPIAPRIVSAQPVPYPVQTPFVWHASVDPTTAPQVPIAAKIIASQPAPPQAAYVFIGRSIPSLVAPVASIVVRSQEPGRPPSFAFIQRPPTGPPPPSLNRPAIPIIVDRNVPPPYGSVRLRKGFAVALPVLGQGSITGGVRTGSAATGGVLERGVIAGGIRTSSASTGGALGAGAMIGLASLPTVLGGGYGVVLYPSDSLLPSDSLFPSEVSVPSGGGGYVAGGVR